MNRHNQTPNPLPPFTLSLLAVLAAEFTLPHGYTLGLIQGASLIAAIMAAVLLYKR